MNQASFNMDFSTPEEQSARMRVLVERGIIEEPHLAWNKILGNHLDAETLTERDATELLHIWQQMVTSTEFSIDKNENKHQIKEKLLHAILDNPENNFKPLAEDLVKNGILTTTEADALFRGWRLSLNSNANFDKTLNAIWNMPELEHLKGPLQSTPSSQINNVHENKVDYRSMLRHYVDDFAFLDYEAVGKNYVATGRLPQIAVDNILHRWRQQSESKSLDENWWNKEGSNITRYLLGLGSFCTGYIIVNWVILSPLDLFNDYFIISFSVAFGCAAQYYVYRQVMLEEIAKRLQKIRTEDHRALRPGWKNYDASDEPIAKSLKLSEWQTELENDSEFNSNYRIIAMLSLIVLAAIILKLL